MRKATPNDVQELLAMMDRPKWHFINYPFKAGTPATVRTKPPDPDNIVRAFGDNLPEVSIAHAAGSSWPAALFRGLLLEGAQRRQ